MAVRKRGGIMPQLEVRDLKKYFYRPKRGGGTGIVRAVDGVAFALPRGETLGLVGESGCGKSTLARLILRILVPDAGDIIYNGENIGRLSGKELLPLRRRMQIVFQNPFGSLNPQMTVGRALSEPLRVHCLAKSTKEIRQKTEELLVLVGLDKSFLERYPHELSGGQRQRIALARALALQPEFIVCDEPVSALDVTSQAQIIALLERLREKLGLTMIFIAHDLRLVKNIADRVAVMYCGRIVELADKKTVFTSPAHPYTRLLLAALPGIFKEKKKDSAFFADVRAAFAAQGGGCSYLPRCPHAEKRCGLEQPLLINVSTGHLVACHLR